MSFQYPSKIKLAHLPTPIVKMTRLSQALNGPEIYIKRDDLTGIALSGNKVRKLEFVVAEALGQQADVLITCGGIQSNHARSTAFAAAQVGLKSCLILRGEPTSEIDGNLFLDRLVNADVKFITPENYRYRIDDIINEVAEELRRNGLKPYIIPEGASNELGALGYMAATEEIVSQLRETNLKIDYVINATGSGGTYAGLLLGKRFYKQNYDVFTVNVCDDEQYFVDRIGKILQRVEDRFELNLGLSHRDIHILDGYIGEGYSIPYPEEIEWIKNITSTEGVVLDPVYTGKAMVGLIDQIRKGRFKKGENVLFIHTGGIFGLFPQRSAFL